MEHKDKLQIHQTHLDLTRLKIHSSKMTRTLVETYSVISVHHPLKIKNAISQMSDFCRNPENFNAALDCLVIGDPDMETNSLARFLNSIVEEI